MKGGKDERIAAALPSIGGGGVLCSRRGRKAELLCPPPPPHPLHSGSSRAHSQCRHGCESLRTSAPPPLRCLAGLGVLVSNLRDPFHSLSVQQHKPTSLPFNIPYCPITTYSTQALHTVQCKCLYLPFVVIYSS